MQVTGCSDFISYTENGNEQSITISIGDDNKHICFQISVAKQGMLVNIQRTIHIPTRMLASLRPLPSGMPHYISKDHALNTANMKGTFPRSQRLFHLLLLIKLRKSLQFTSCSVNVFGETPSFLRAQTQRTALRGEYITFLPCLVANCRANSADCAGSLQCISFLQVFAWGSSLLLHKNDTL